MIIRKAELKDVDDVLFLTNNFFNESLSSYGLNLEEKTIRNTLTHYISNLIGIVAEDNGKVVAAIGGFVAPSIFDENQLIGQETIWFVDKNYRSGTIGLKLIFAFEEECKSRGANLVAMVHMGNCYADVLDKFYNIRGYRIMEKQYIKEI